MMTIERRDFVVAAGLAAVAGFVDAVGFVALGGFFVSLITGNSTRAAVDLMAGDLTSVRWRAPRHSGDWDSARP